MSKLHLLLPLSAVAIATLGCPGFGRQDPGAVVIDPDAPPCENVALILEARCNGCHGSQPEAGAPPWLRTDSFVDVGDAYGVLTYIDGIGSSISEGRMPPAITAYGAITPDESAYVLEWIANGGAADACLPGSDAGRDAGTDAATDGGTDASDGGPTDTSDTAPDVTITATWDEVLAIFTANCTSRGCHDVRAGGGLDLVTGDVRARILGPSPTVDLNLIEPGDPASSYLFLKMTGAFRDAGGSGTNMPVRALGAAQIATVRAWIEAGALP
jgi:mono/diheme cytochrome c family protein